MKQNSQAILLITFFIICKYKNHNLKFIEIRISLFRIKRQILKNKYLEPNIGYKISRKFIFLW